MSLFGGATSLTLPIVLASDILMTPTGFSSLPDEVIQTILSYDAAQDTLLSLVLCSRQLYRLFFPYLYQNIRVGNTLSSDRLRCLASTLVKDLSLATNVRSFKFRDDSPSGQFPNNETHRGVVSKTISDSPGRATVFKLRSWA